MNFRTTENTTPAEKSFFEKRPILAGILILLITFLILDLGLGKVFIPENYQSFRIRDPWYHHGIMPNQAAITNWGQKYYKFYSNSLGFRDDTIRKIKPKNQKRRILFLGDSHTEAVGIPYEKSFTGILSNKLEKQGVEVLNAAAVSYSPKIHYLKTQHLIEKEKLKVNEIFVLIDMSDLNNEIAYERFLPRNDNGFKTFLRRNFKTLSSRSLTTHLIYRAAKSIRNRFFMKNMAESDNANLELYASFFSEFENAELLNDPNFHHVSRWLEDEKFRKLANYSLKEGQENIAKLKILCDNNDIKLNLSVHPWPEQVLKRDSTNLYTQSWARFCQKQNINFINLYPEFINHENPVLTAEHNYIPEDNHWNENGHRRVAEVLFEIISTIE